MAAEATSGPVRPARRGPVPFGWLALQEVAHWRAEEAAAWRRGDLGAMKSHRKRAKAARDEGTLIPDTLALYARNYLGLPGEQADRLARSAAGPDGRIDEAEYALAAGQMQAEAPADPPLLPGSGKRAPADLTYIVVSGDREIATSYYFRRAVDFVGRHPGKRQPPYYFDYGDKYVNRFTERIQPRLTPQGQAWMDRARSNLQAAIEAELRVNPALELDAEAFQDFAYASHNQAYLSAGFSELPLQDILTLLGAPDFQDLVNVRGMTELALLAVGVLRKKLAHEFRSAVRARR